jgi:hypothetical protein
MAAGTGRRLLVAASCGALTVGVGAGAAYASPPSGAGPAAPVVVVSGLNNPRQLSLVHDDVLLVGEAGKGGTVATITGPEGAPEGLGYSGSVSAVLAPAYAHNQQPHRIVRGLPSAAAATDTAEGPKGSLATGPDGVSADSLNRIAVIETFFGPAATAGVRPLQGRLLLTTPYGAVHPIADITGFERTHDPDGKGFDSDPYAVLAYRGGWLVTDAAGNDVLQVSRSGAISVFHVFPNVKTGPCATQFDPAPPFAGCNFVPTSLATDRWGNVYVGGLSSLVPGQARVVKLDDDGRVLKVWGGFSAVTGLAVSDDGSLYVSQLFATEAHPANPMIQGVLTRIKGTRRSDMDVPFPAGLVIDSKNNIYVSAFSILPDTGAGIPGVDTSGQVWRVRF